MSAWALIGEIFQNLSDSTNGGVIYSPKKNLNQRIEITCVRVWDATFRDKTDELASTFTHFQ